MFRAVFHVLSKPVIYLLKPFKVFAYRTRFQFLRRLIIEGTAFFDWMMIFLNMQNETMLLHYYIYNKGNFIFGKAIMVTDYAAAADRIAKPMLKNSNFMGVPFLAASAFADNSPPIFQDPSPRRVTREHINQHIFTPRVRAFDIPSTRDTCGDILEEWKADPKMAHFLRIRSMVTAIITLLLTEVRLSSQESQDITKSYFWRFGQLTGLYYYFPWIAGVLGSHEHIKSDAYYPLKAKGVDQSIASMTLFAAMFSIGTLVIRCVENTRRYGVDYQNLSDEEKRNYIIESLRLYPTVTTVHRVLDTQEEVQIGKKRITLKPGDEIDYPFVCSHLDETAFKNAASFDIHRPQEEYDKVLSWSKGFHECPARELSIVVTTVMLETLAQRFDLTKLEIPQLIV